MLDQTLGFFNPWWYEEYVPPGRIRTEYLQKIERGLEIQKSVIVSGLRRVGKTTILRQFIASRIPHVGGKRIFYASMDHPDVKGTSIIDLLAMFRRINKVKRQEKQLLILDEVHHREGFEKEIKALIDIEDGLQVVASGSSSLVIKHKSSAMTGRYMKVYVRPLSFLEYLEFNNESFDPSQPQLMEALLEDYLICGGMPQYVIHRDPQLLLDIIDDIIYKDIALEYEIRDPTLLKEMFFLLMDRVGKPLSYGKIGNLVNIGNDADYTKLRFVLLYNGGKMEASIIKVSSKGQIVIPAQWRRRLNIKEGEELLAVGEGDTLLLKKIEKSAVKKEFEESVAPIRKKIKKLGVTKEDVKNAIKKAREK